MPSPIWICKKNEILCHLRSLFKFYGEDINYIDKYLNDILKFDINDSLLAVRDLVRHIHFQKSLNKDVQNGKDEARKYQSPFAEWKGKI